MIDIVLSIIPFRFLWLTLLAASSAYSAYIMLITWAKTAQRWGLSFDLLRIDVYPLFHLQMSNYGE